MFRRVFSLSIFLLISAEISSAASSKLDPRARAALAIAEGDTGEELPGIPVALDAGGRLDVFISASAGRAELEAAGAIIRSELPGGIFTAWIPAGAVAAIEGLTGVRAIQGAAPVDLELDVSAPTTNISFLRGPGPSFPGLNGEDIIIGDVDTGISWAHEDFKNALGQTRILNIWDQTDLVGPNPSDFAYGTEWHPADIDAGIVRQDDVILGHGTHVMSIAAGDGSMVGPGGPPAYTYAGIAPKADIIMVKTDFTTTGIVDGVAYVFNRASELGKLAVVNLSLGTHFGSHDGASAFEMAIDALTGPGRIIVKAAGNERGQARHAEVFAGGSPTEATFLVTGSATGRTLAIDGYYESTEDMMMTIVPPSGPVIGPLTRGSINAAYPGLVTPNGTVYVENGAFTTSGGDYEVYLEVTAGAGQNMNGVWAVQFSPVLLGSDAGQVDLWRYFTTTGLNANFQTGNQPTEELVSEPGNTAQVITVGGWTTRQSWIDCGGRTFMFSGLPVGNLYAGSSPGPTRDGRLKPDIAAPGTAIGAARSLDLPSSCGPNPTTLLPGLRHVIQQGTSMAAPHASGVCAMLLKHYGPITPSLMKGYLVNDAVADAFTGPVPNNDWGHGKLRINDLTPGMPLSRAEAMALVEMNIIGPSPYAARLVGFLHNQTAIDSVLPPGTVVSDRDSTFLLTVTDPSFFFWLDLDVGFEFDHATSFVFVNQLTGALTAIPSRNWPLVNDVEPLEFLNGNASLDRFHGSYPVSAIVHDYVPVASGDPKTWAVVAVGRNQDGQEEKGARRNDVSRIKEAINSAERGPKVPAGNIKEVSGPGYCGASKQEICTALSMLTGCDKIFFFYTGHGDKGKMLTRGATPQKSEDFTYEELGKKLLATGATQVCIVLEACHSGSAVAILDTVSVTGADGKPRRLKGSVVTSSHADLPTRRSPDGTPFLKGFHECMLDTLADLNRDKKTGIIEAVAWAVALNDSVRTDLPQARLLADGRVVEFPPPDVVPKVTSGTPDGAGTLHYSIESVYYRVLRVPGIRKDTLVCKRFFYLWNENNADHVGEKLVEVSCTKKGMKHVIKKFKVKLKAKKMGPNNTMNIDKICVGEVPDSCTNVQIRGVNSAPRELSPLSAEIFNGAILNRRASVYSLGEPIFQEIEVTEPPGLMIAASLDSIPGWNMGIAPGTLTTSADLDTDYVFVTGCMPDTATRGGTFCAALIGSDGDTTALRVEALLYGSLPLPLSGGESYFHRALSTAGGISVTGGTARLVDTRLDLTAGTSCTVGPAGTLEMTRSVVRPDSGVSYTAQVNGGILWQNGSFVGASGGLVLNGAHGRMAGGGIIDAVGDGLTLMGNQSALDASFLLVDGSTDDGLVLNGTSNCRLDWMHILNSAGNDVELLNNATAELVDSNFEDSKVAVPAGSTLTRSWSTGFLLTTPAGAPMPGVVLEVRNALGGLVAVDTTEVSGMSDLHALVEYRRAGPTFTSHTPHTLMASYAGLDTAFTFPADSTQVIEILWNAATSGEPHDPDLPMVAVLAQNTPNPFLRSTTIRFSLSRPGTVRLSIFDLQGREVTRLIDGPRPEGAQEIRWEPAHVAAGVYWYRLTAGGRVQARRLVLGAGR